MVWVFCEHIVSAKKASVPYPFFFPLITFVPDFHRTVFVPLNVLLPYFIFIPTTTYVWSHFFCHHLFSSLILCVMVLLQAIATLGYGTQPVNASL